MHVRQASDMGKPVSDAERQALPKPSGHAVSEITPEKLKLLKQAIDIQERMLDGVTQVFRGLSHHHDAGVSSVAESCIRLIGYNRDVIEALVDGLNQTKH